MDAQVKQKVQMPLGIRKKMMAAISMLLVASIMLVSSSYAWFTLSTAPEITGITTSVGANGNLEIALLTTETFSNPDQITSNTGDSMTADGKTAETANITWGNLIDLSNHTAYGMNKITLYPAKLNKDTADANKLATAPLGTPVYGADGRVEKVEASTGSAVYDSANSVFTLDDTQTYGVRAVGTSSNVTARQIILKTAKGNYVTKVNAIASPIRTAVTANIKPFLTLAAAGGAPESYTYEQVVAMKDIATGVQNSLNNIVVAYANAGLARAAADGNVTDTQVAALEIAIANKTGAAELQGLLNSAENGAVTAFNAELTALADLQNSAAGVVSGLEDLLEGANPSSTFSSAEDKAVVSNAVNTLLGAGLPLQDAGGNVVSSAEALSANALYLVGGVVNSVAEYSGTFHLTTQLGVAVYAGVANYDNAKKLDASALSTLNAAGAETAAANITDFYGYIIDFAFRTNAASSNLQLQTAAMNRVYSDVTDSTMATQGAGSTVTFSYADAGLTSSQASKLLDSIRIVFFNPDSNDIYGTAKITNIAAGGSSATGEVYLIAQETVAYELGQDAFEAETVTSYAAKSIYNAGNTVDFKATLTAEEYEALDDVTIGSGEGDEKFTLGADAYEPVVEITGYTIKTGDDLRYGDTVITTAQCTNYVQDDISAAAYASLKSKTTETKSYTMAADKSAITPLQQNIVQKVSTLVYLDGENIDNSAVANATSSGTLKLNLQFSSSATLNPMQNNALKTMEKSAAAQTPSTPDAGADEGDQG